MHRLRAAASSFCRLRAAHNGSTNGSNACRSSRIETPIRDCHLGGLALATTSLLRSPVAVAAAEDPSPSSLRGNDSASTTPSTATACRGGTGVQIHRRRFEVTTPPPNESDDVGRPSGSAQPVHSDTKPRPLVDAHGRTHNYLRISLTERCNLRCTYCMPEHGIDLTPDARLLTFAETERLIALFARLGVSKMRFTGGEPLVYPRIVDVCRVASAQPGVRDVALTTNGIVLHRKAADLRAAGVTGLNISLDTFDEGRFMLLTRRNGLAKVLRGLEQARTLQFPKVKINCVVMRGVNEDELGRFAELTRDDPVEVRFIEYMPFDDNQWSREKMVPFDEMVARIEHSLRPPGEGDADTSTAAEAHPETKRRLYDPRRNKSEAPDQTSTGGRLSSTRASLVSSSRLPPAALRGPPFSLLQPSPIIGETAKLYTIPGYRGTLGFITSMSSHFCGTCNRLRLTADGSLKVCLFGNEEVSLRDPMRAGATDAELEAIIRDALWAKAKEHGGKSSPEEIAASKNRAMIRIGGQCGPPRSISTTAALCPSLPLRAPVTTGSGTRDASASAAPTIDPSAWKSAPRSRSRHGAPSRRHGDKRLLGWVHALQLVTVAARGVEGLGDDTSIGNAPTAATALWTRSVQEALAAVGAARPPHYVALSDRLLGMLICSPGSRALVATNASSHSAPISTVVAPPVAASPSLEGLVPTQAATAAAVATAPTLARAVLTLRAHQAALGWLPEERDPSSSRSSHEGGAQPPRVALPVESILALGHRLVRPDSPLRAAQVGLLHEALLSVVVEGPLTAEAVAALRHLADVAAGAAPAEGEDTESKRLADAGCEVASAGTATDHRRRRDALFRGLLPEAQRSHWVSPAVISRRIDNVRAVRGLSGACLAVLKALNSAARDGGRRATAVDGFERWEDALTLIGALSPRDALATAATVHAESRRAVALACAQGMSAADALEVLQAVGGLIAAGKGHAQNGTPRMSLGERCTLATAAHKELIAASRGSWAVAAALLCSAELFDVAAPLFQRSAAGHKGLALVPPRPVAAYLEGVQTMAPATAAAMLAAAARDATELPPPGVATAAAEVLCQALLHGSPPPQYVGDLMDALTTVGARRVHQGRALDEWSPRSPSHNPRPRRGERAAVIGSEVERALSLVAAALLETAAPHSRSRTVAGTSDAALVLRLLVAPCPWQQAGLTALTFRHAAQSTPVQYLRTRWPAALPTADEHGGLPPTADGGAPLALGPPAEARATVLAVLQQQRLLSSLVLRRAVHGALLHTPALDGRHSRSLPLPLLRALIESFRAEGEGIAPAVSVTAGASASLQISTGLLERLAEWRASGRSLTCTACTASTPPSEEQSVHRAPAHKSRGRQSPGWACHHVAQIVEGITTSRGRPTS